MAQTSLKKKIMAATVAAAMSVGTTVAVAPVADAQYYNGYAYNYRYECWHQFQHFFKQEANPSIQLDVDLVPGWTHRITSGGNIADVKSDGRFLYITPKPGARGVLELDIYDHTYKRYYHYYFSLDNSVNAPKQNTGDNRIVYTQNYSFVWNFFGAGFGGQLPIPSGYRVTNVIGREYVDCKEVNGVLLITPKPGADRKNVVVEFTNGQGQKITNTVTINLDVQVNVGEQVVHDGRTVVLEKTGDYRVIKGGELIVIREDNGKLIVEGQPGKEGNAVIEIKDGRGNVNYYNITVVNNIKVDVQNATLENRDKFTARIQGQWDVRFIEGQQFVKVDRQGDRLIVEGAPNANGTTIIEIVDGKGNVIGRYTFVVKSNVQTTRVTQEIDDRTDFKVTRGSSTNTLEITKGRGLVNVEPQSDGSWLVHTLKGQTGIVVIEERDQWNNLLTEYTLTIIEADIPNKDIDIKTTDEVTLTGTNLVIVQGGQFASLTKVGGAWTLKPNGGEGKVVIENRDDRGQAISTYTVTIKKVEPVVTQVIPVTLINNSSYIINVLMGLEYTIKGNSDVVEIIRENGQIILQGKPGKTGKLTIEAKNNNGDTVTVYEIDVQNPAKPDTIVHKGEITNTGYLEVSVNPGNTPVITKGGEYVSLREVDGKFRVVPKDGVKTGYFEVEERDSDGHPWIRYEIDIKESIQRGEQNPPAVNKGQIDIVGNNPNGPVIIRVTDGQNHVIIKDATGEYTLERQPDGTFTVKGGRYKLVPNGDGTYTLQFGDGTPVTGSVTINNVTINVTESTNTTGGGSSNKELPPECIGAIAATTLPLLLAIPLGILSQVQVPGFEAAHAQLNEAIREVNNQIQRGLGIFNEDRAGAAARADNAAAQIAPVIGAVGTAIAAIAAIAGIGYGVLVACKVVPAPESSSDRGVEKPDAPATNEGASA